MVTRRAGGLSFFLLKLSEPAPFVMAGRVQPRGLWLAGGLISFGEIRNIKLPHLSPFGSVLSKPLLLAPSPSDSDV